MSRCPSLTVTNRFMRYRATSVGFRNLGARTWMRSASSSAISDVSARVLTARSCGGPIQSARGDGWPAARGHKAGERCVSHLGQYRAESGDCVEAIPRRQVLNHARLEEGGIPDVRSSDRGSTPVLSLIPHGYVPRPKARMSWFMANRRIASVMFRGDWRFEGQYSAADFRSCKSWGTGTRKRLTCLRGG